MTLSWIGFGVNSAYPKVDLERRIWSCGGHRIKPSAGQMQNHIHTDRHRAYVTRFVRVSGHTFRFINFSESGCHLGCACTDGAIDPAFFEQPRLPHRSMWRLPSCNFSPAAASLVRAYNPTIANMKPGTLNDMKWLDPVGNIWPEVRSHGAAFRTKLPRLSRSQISSCCINSIKAGNRSGAGTQGGQGHANE